MSLPLPGHPASSWGMFKARLAAAFQGVDKRVVSSFWLFGLINNVLYVIILSAALDLVGPSVPKGVVLLADVVPGFLTKLCAPYFIHTVPYSIRVLILVGLSATGMLLIAVTPGYTDGGTISTKLAGVVLASLSGGAGELSFLGLTHYYGPFSLAAWASGTGGAGLIGAGAYALATTSLGFSPRVTMGASAFLPLIMLISFFMILPHGPLRAAQKHQLQAEGEITSSLDTEADIEDATDNGPITESQGLLSPDSRSSSPKRTFHSHSSRLPKEHSTHAHDLRTNLRRARSLFFPFMLPLLLVYIAEYTINQGVSPVLLFPLPETPFTHYRSFYPFYNFLYQLGVFISRSSVPFVRLHNLYLPSLLQCVNLVFLISHSLYNFIPNVYIVFAVVFWEGLLGGAVYVNTFAEIRETVRDEDREFSLGATTVSDSGGICVAGFLGMALEVALCDWQIKRFNRDWCRKL